MTFSAVASGASSYTTLSPGPPVRHELLIKRSRFITVLWRVEDEEAARDALGAVRREFADARHHCSALLLGPDRAVQRAQDDGEPAGTAGVPMLEALRRRPTAPSGAAPTADLSDLLAVVVRYFGGVLLGAGGLVRAYSASVSEALDAAPLVRRHRLRHLTITVPHATAGRLDNELRAAGLRVTGTRYEPQAAVLSLAVADTGAALAAVHTLVAGLTAGQATLVAAGTVWADAAPPR